MVLSRDRRVVAVEPAPFARPSVANGVMDIFVEPGPGIPVIKLAVHDGNFNGWVNLTPWEAVKIALKLLEAANGVQLPQSPYTEPIEPPKRKRGRPPSVGRRVPRVGAQAAGNVDDIPGGVDGHAQGGGGQA
jgi:hypothetical protein